MNSIELYDQIFNEIISIQEAQNYSQKEYVVIFGDILDRDDYEDMMFYFYDIDRNLSFMYETLYYRIIYFFEHEKQFSILNDFIDRYKKRMFDPNEIRKKYLLEDFDVEVFMLIEELRIFFYIFQKFYLDKEDNDLNNAGLILRNKLETILKNLNYFLKDKQITKEKDFYTYVNKLVRTVFPDCQDHQNIQIIKKLKSYIPDISIPECKSIIELKYVDSKEKFKSCIESIDVDVKGYSGIENIKYFYAIFFCKELYYSPDEIEIVWKERNYPKEWKYYIVHK